MQDNPSEFPEETQEIDMPLLVRGKVARCPSCAAEIGYTGNPETMDCPICEGTWPTAKMTSDFYQEVSRRIREHPFLVNTLRMRLMEPWAR